MKIRNVEGKQFQQRNQLKSNSNNQIKGNTNILFGNRAKAAPSILGGIMLSVASILPSNAQTPKQEAMLRQFAQEETNSLNMFLQGVGGSPDDPAYSKYCCPEPFAGTRSIGYKQTKYCDLDSLLSTQPEFAKLVKATDQATEDIFEVNPKYAKMTVVEKTWSNNAKKNIEAVNKVLNIAKKEYGSPLASLISLKFRAPYEVVKVDTDNYAIKIKDAYFDLGKKYANFNCKDEVFIKNLRKSSIADIRKEIFDKFVRKRIIIAIYKKR